MPDLLEPPRCHGLGTSVVGYRSAEAPPRVMSPFLYLVSGRVASAVGTGHEANPATSWAAPPPLCLTLIVDARDPVSGECCGYGCTALAPTGWEEFTALES